MKRGINMVLYIFTNHREKISREEIEVVEKNTYFENDNSPIKKRYKKSDLDVVKFDGKFVEMISLCGRVDIFVEKVIECKKQKISELQKQMVAEQNSIISIKQKFNHMINSNIDGKKYISSDYLKFKIDGDRVKGVVLNTGVQKHDIGILIDGNDFAVSYDEVMIDKILNIFVDGRNTNLSIVGFNNVSEETCFITIEKLKEFCNKAKVTVNIA
jgi:hypothetical protein